MFDMATSVLAGGGWKVPLGCSITGGAEEMESISRPTSSTESNPSLSSSENAPELYKLSSSVVKGIFPSLLGEGEISETSSAE